jgi:hypothetical protein
MRKVLLILILLLTVFACSIPNQQPAEIQTGLESQPTAESQPQPIPPAGWSIPQTFAYGGNAMTFNPDGNSLFVMSHDRMPYGYQHPDEWGGGAWLTTDSGKGAVLFAGTKSNGEKYWYGYINPDSAGLCTGTRCRWSKTYRACLEDSIAIRFSPASSRFDLLR